MSAYEQRGVQLRDVLPGDLPLFFARQLDADAARMAGFPAKERAAFMAHWTRILDDETVVKRTILLVGADCASDGVPQVFRPGLSLATPPPTSGHHTQRVPGGVPGAGWA